MRVKMVGCVVLLLMCGCATAPPAFVANGEYVHKPGATRERCLHWLLDGHMDHRRWRLILDELEAEPKATRAAMIQEVALKLDTLGWPDTLRTLPRHWTPETIAARKDLLPLIRHVDGSYLSETWSQEGVKLSPHVPNVTTLTIRSSAQAKAISQEFVGDPRAFPRVRHLHFGAQLPSVFTHIDRGGDTYSYTYRSRKLNATDALSTLQRPWAARLETLSLQLPLGDKHVAMLTRTTLPSLRAFTLEGRVSLHLMEALGGASWMKGVRRLTLSRLVNGDAFTAFLRGLQDTSRLEFLKLDSERRCAGFGAVFGKRGWRRLQELHLNRCGQDAATIKAIAYPKDMFALRVLGLRNSGLTDVSMYALSGSWILRDLHTLSLSGHQRFTTQGLGYVLLSSKLGALERLRVEMRASAPGIATIFGRARALDALKELSLRTAMPAEVATLVISTLRSPQLERLDLGNNRCDASSVRALIKAPFVRTIKHLNLSSNPIGDAGVEILANSPMWPRYLDLSRSGIGDAGFKALVRAPAFRLVETLLVAANEWTHEGAVVLKGGLEFERLHTLNVRENKLGGAENIMEAFLTPAGLHMHRPQLDWEGLDVAQDDIEDVYQNYERGSSNPDGEDSGGTQAIMNVLVRFASLPGLGERFAGSSYLSASLRRDLHRIIERAKNYMRGKEAIKYVPGVARELTIAYVDSIKRINDDKRVTPPLPAVREPWLRWKGGWFEFQED